MANTSGTAIQPEMIEMVTRMAYMAEIKEWDNRFHLERVRKFAFIICRGMDMPQYAVELIPCACMLHDIGKIMLPDQILNIHGNYLPTDKAVIENHTTNGAMLLSGSRNPLMQMAETIALSHHERWDGSGYPNRLSGEQIPLPGRICAVADVFDALVTKKSYKPAMTFDDAFKLLTKPKNSLFDPAVIRICVSSRQEIAHLYSTSESQG